MTGSQPKGPGQKEQQKGADTAPWSFCQAFSVVSPQVKQAKDVRNKGAPTSDPGKEHEEKYKTGHFDPAQLTFKLDNFFSLFSFPFLNLGPHSCSTTVSFHLLAVSVPEIVKL